MDSIKENPANNVLVKAINELATLTDIDCGPLVATLEGPKGRAGLRFEWDPRSTLPVMPEPEDIYANGLAAQNNADIAAEANAPDPSVMRQEFINIVSNGSHARIPHTRAEKIVDAILQKQMQFYAAMADPQLEADNMAQVQAIMDTKGIIEALVRQGAAVVEYMPDKEKWQRLAARARELAARMEDMFS